MAAATATPEQMRAIMITERTSSTLSVLGLIFIFATFSYWPSFRKPITRLILYASFGNAVANITTLISTSGNAASAKSTLCQTQAFITQMRYDQRQLRALEWKYGVLCYGIPLIPAFVFLFIRSKERGLFYGPAVMWCWVGNGYSIFHIATFYAPILVVMCITFAIYIRVGVEIYRKGRMLRSLAYQYSGSSSMSKPLSKKSNGSRSTEVRITSEPMNVQVVPHAQIRSDEGMAAKGYDEYTITIEAKGESQDGEPATEQQIPLERRPVLRSHGSSANDSNAAAWGYARCAFFFFLAMLVTWTPSSIGRFYALANPTKFNFPLMWLTAFVLPLQGFWNCVIYISTSLPACKTLWASLWERSSERVRGALSRKGLHASDRQGAMQV